MVVDQRLAIQLSRDDEVRDLPLESLIRDGLYDGPRPIGLDDVMRHSSVLTSYLLDHITALEQKVGFVGFGTL